VSETWTVLVIEDGSEYTEALDRLRPKEGSPMQFVRAANLAEARSLLESRAVDAVLLDVVFDRSPDDSLAGDLDALVTRFGGDRPRAIRHLAENQGFYILDALAPILLPGAPVVLAYDFSLETSRFESLRRRVPGLSGLPDGASLSRAIELLRG